MTSRSSSRASSRGLSESLKRFLRIGPRSRPSSRIGSSLAATINHRSSSPTPSDAPSQAATIHPSYCLELYIAGDNAGSSTEGPNAMTSPCNLGSPEPSTQDENKGAEKSAWAGLEKGLKVLEKGTELFPPLNSAISGFTACLDIVKAATENRENYEELASELRAMMDILGQYANELSSEDPNGSIANIALSIENEVERIKKKQNRCKAERVFESSGDREDIIQCYHRVEASFRQLQNNAVLWTMRKMNKQSDAYQHLGRQYEFTLLQGMSPEEDARYNSHFSTTIHRHSCTAETREGIHADLQDWVRDPNGAKVYWMNGMAGTGKTTIAYSLCEWLEANKLLGANFFCSRAKDSCRDVSRLVPTIASQLARYSPAIRSALCRVLESDQGISKLNVVQQFDKLVKGPLLEAQPALPDGVVIVIDALDECEDNHGVRLVLATLMRFVPALPVKFFVASRPEPTIWEKMQSSSDYSPTVLRLHDIEESIVKEDIAKYLREALHSMSPPPSNKQIEQLAKDAGKLFIYAATIVRYILPGNPPVNSSARLKTMLGAGSSPRSTQKHKELDRLYTTILMAAFSDHLEEEEKEIIQLVLRTAVCAKEPLNAQTLASLLAVSGAEVLSALQPLLSVLHVSEDDGVVSTFHASFSEYLLDRQRSGDYYCDKAKHDLLLADRCFEIMEEQLRFNICSLETSFEFDKDVPRLNERIKEFIPSALFYACRYWGEHLRRADDSDVLGYRLVEFLSWRLLFWMEVLNLKRCVVAGVTILSQVRHWLVGNSLLNNAQQLVVDAQDFVTRFAASACTRSTPHIYISALPFCPKTSAVYTLYWGRTQGLIDVKGTAISQRAKAAIATWGTDSKINTVAFSPDGRCIASGSDDGTIRLQDVRTGDTIVGPFHSHRSMVLQVAFSPDGARMVSTSNDDTTRLWDAQTGNLLLRLPRKAGKAMAGSFEEHTVLVNPVAFSPDGTGIVSGSDYGIRAWNAHTGGIIAGMFEGNEGRVHSVAFSPDGTHLVSGSDDGSIQLWNAQTGGIVAMFQKHEGSVNSVSFSPDSDTFASGSDDCTIRVWCMRANAPVAEPFIGHTGSVRSVAFSPNAVHVVSGSNDRTVRVWDAHNRGVLVGLFVGHMGWVNSVAFSPDGAYVVSASRDRTIRVWDAHNSDPISEIFEGNTDRVHSVAFSPDGTRLVSGSNEGTIRLWDARTGKTIATPFKGHSDSVHSLAFAPDGTCFVSGSDDHTIQLWNATTGKSVAEPFRGHTSWVRSVTFSPDGAHIASGSDDGSIRVWDVRTGESISVLRGGIKGGVNSVAFSPDSDRIVSGSGDCIIRIWSALSGSVVTAPVRGHTGSIQSVAFSPNGNRIASGSRDFTVGVWDACAGTAVTELLYGHTHWVNSVAFSPDGTRIVSASEDRTIRVWDARTGHAIATPLIGHTSSIYSIAFSPDGAHVASGSNDRMIQVWDVGSPAVDEAYAWRASLASNAHNRWNFANDGWITLNDAPFLCISQDLHKCFPIPPNPLAIGLPGSFQVESWDLFLDRAWVSCHNSGPAQ